MDGGWRGRENLRLNDATNLKELPEIVDLTERHRHQYQGLQMLRIRKKSVTRTNEQVDGTGRQARSNA